MKSETISGAFVPLTMSGNIVVEGVFVSCFASVDHDLGLIGMTPIRWFPRLVGLILGEKESTSTFVSLIMAIGEWMEPY